MIYIGNRVQRLKNCGPRAGITQAASMESVNLRGLVRGEARGPLWHGVRLEVIGPIG